MGRKIYKKIRNYICIILISLSVLVVCLGCSPHGTGGTPPKPNCPIYETTPRRETPMSVEEIREMIQKRYFNEDGSVNKDRWQESEWLTQSELEGFLNQEITGFDVQIVKDVAGKEESFLVEFEPTGYAIGSVWRER